MMKTCLASHDRRRTARHRRSSHPRDSQQGQEPTLGSTTGLAVALTAGIRRHRGRRRLRRRLPQGQRLDGFLNDLQRPRVGTVFLIPRRGDALRINGSARIIADAPHFDEMAIGGKRTILALEIDEDILKTLY